MRNRAATIDAVRKKYELLKPLLNERLRRRWAACEAESLGRGGVSQVAEATGMSRTTITAGARELRRHENQGQEELPPERIRAPGAGRPSAVTCDPQLRQALEALVEPATRGDPERPLLWTSKSTRRLAEELRRQGHAVTHQTVANLLTQWDYSLGANRKTKEGRQHPDRDAQFEYLNRRVLAFQRQGQPVISVDAKNKELVGDFKRPGREWRHKDRPERVRSKDFLDQDLGKAIPEGVYDLTRNEGWVSVGIDHDTAEFAGVTIHRWWVEMGRRAYPKARRLLITADAGGSNGYRVRLWKRVVQELADATGLEISVCHFPPGTSKWNKIEHRMFCHISANWRGRPLRSLGIIVNLIGHTRTSRGLSIQAELDTGSYPTGIEVTDEEMAAIRLKPDRFHGDWNYMISPNS
jgi:hypothetical protein